MRREIPLEAPYEDVAKALETPRIWPLWHFGIHAITGKFETGELLTLHFASHIKPWKHHEIGARILEWIPRKKVTLELVSDSSGKLQKMVSGYRWTIELHEKTVSASVSAHTESFRARLLSIWVPRIFMHQMLYPNLIQLTKGAPTKQAGFSLNPTPPN